MPIRRKNRRKDFGVKGMKKGIHKAIQKAMNTRL
jgi:hypothetical protein